MSKKNALPPFGKVLSWGDASFTGTGLTVEVFTNLDEDQNVCLVILPKVDYASDEHFFSDGVITDGAVTVSRSSTAPTSGLSFWWVALSMR